MKKPTRKQPTRKQWNAALDVLADYFLSPLLYGLVTNWIEREGKKADGKIKSLPPELQTIVRLALQACVDLDKKHKAAHEELYFRSTLFAESYVSEFVTRKAKGKRKKAA